MAKTYSSAAVAIALNISEAKVIEVAGNKPTLSDILTLDDNAKISRYTDEAESIRKLIAGVKALEK
jgi:hypothetical protein